MSSSYDQYVQVRRSQVEQWQKAAKETQELAWKQKQEQEKQQRLEKQQKHLEARLKEQDRQMKQHYQNLQIDIKKLRQDLQGQIDQITNRIQQQYQNAQAIGKEWIRMLEQELHYLETHPSHKIFFPHELEDLQIQLTQAKKNLENKVAEAAIALAQENFRKALQLDRKLQEKEQAWHEAHDLALEKFEQTQSLFRDSCEVDFQMEGAEQQVKLDVNTWSNHALDSLQTQIKTMQTRLELSPFQLSMEELQEITTTSEETYQKIRETVYQAQDSFVSSVFRANFQIDLSEKLEGLGYVLEDSCWEGNDERKAYHQVLRDDNGNKIVTIARAPFKNAEF
ncbi:hypothetical protein WDW89_16945 [Deltaproteobacteria bacterium TL4]